VLSSCRLYTGCHRDRKQVSSRLILEHRHDPSFDSAFNGLTMRHRTVCFRSSPQHSPDALSGRLFPRRSPPRLLNAAALGQFEACSCKPTSGGQLPSLIQHHELALVFVTHCRSSAHNLTHGAWCPLPDLANCPLRLVESSKEPLRPPRLQSRFTLKMHEVDFKY